MSKWKQETYVDGKLRYEPKILTADDMVSRLAQISFLRQAGDDIELHIVSHDEMFCVTMYKCVRKLADRIIVHLYEKIEG